jgi:predicted dehydrogenase
MKYALIGCGRISPNHVQAALNNKLDIVGLCDLVEDNIKDKILKFNLSNSIHTYTDYQEMLAKEQPDLVAIATESGKHAQIALDSLDAGCNIIIEKPIALSLADADKIIAKAREKNLVVCTNHQNRFNKAIQKIREALDKNRFGKMYYGTAHIRWCRDYEYYQRALWRGTWEQDGGTLMNQCIHDIDLLRWMLGDEVEEVMGMTGRLAHPYIEAEDLGLALVKFKNGAFGTIEGTSDIYPKNLEETLYLFGEKGTVKAGGTAVNTIDEWRFSDYLENPEEVIAKYHEAPPNVYGFGHTPLYEDVIDAIQSHRKPYVDAEAGRRALELVLGIYKSAAENRPIKFPLEDCSTMEFKGLFEDKR